MPGGVNSPVRAMGSIGRDPVFLERGEGSHVWDGEGRRLIDFSSQMVNTNIGHSHPKVVAAIQEQAARIATIQITLTTSGVIARTARQPVRCAPRRDTSRRRP